MALNPFNEVDYYAEAKTRYTDAFKDKPVFDKYLRLMLNGFLPIQEATKQLMQLRSLDVATGKNLDIIGDIVGQERILVNTGLYIYFGMNEDAAAGSLGTVTDSSKGYPLYSVTNESTSDYRYIDDATYRLFIRSKILKNVSGVSPEEIIEFFNFLFQTEQTLLEEQYPAKCIIRIGRDLSFQEEQFLAYSVLTEGYADRLFPKPVGVEFEFEQGESPFLVLSGAWVLDGSQTLDGVFG